MDLKKIDIGWQGYALVGIGIAALFLSNKALAAVRDAIDAISGAPGKVLNVVEDTVGSVASAAKNVVKGAEPPPPTNGVDTFFAPIFDPLLTTFNIGAQAYGDYSPSDRAFSVAQQGIKMAAIKESASFNNTRAGTIYSAITGEITPIPGGSLIEQDFTSSVTPDTLSGKPVNSYIDP